MISDKKGNKIVEGDIILVTEPWGSFRAEVFIRDGIWMYGEGRHPYLPLYCRKYELTKGSNIEIISSTQL